MLVSAPGGDCRSKGLSVLILAPTLAAVALTPLRGMITRDVSWAQAPRYGLLGLGLAFGLAALLRLGVRKEWPLLYLAPERGLSVRLVGLVAGLGLALAGWWIVPSLRGDNLLSAERDVSALVAQVEALPPGDRAGLQAQAAHRQRLHAGFPHLRQQLALAEHAWEKRTEQATQALLVRVKDARLEALEQVRQEHFQAAAELAESRTAEFEREARALGQMEEIRKLRDHFAAVARVARLAGAEDRRAQR